MCGIAGLIAKNNQLRNDKIISNMTSRLIHRGPDDSNIWSNENVGLGHRRLSILDLTNAGKQPMISKNSRYIITYNGEIYNYKSIRQELIQSGVSFKSSCDTEIILEGFNKWGKNILNRLNGMFAFAIYDKKNNNMLLARDRFGIKPLFYFNDENFFLFASEIKALFASKLIKKKLDNRSLIEYIHYGSSLGEKTFFNKIKMLKPGHIIEVDKKNFVISLYKDSIPTKIINDNYGDAVNKTKYLLEESVKSQLISDVPVGVFLSGGIDSSAIASLASKHSSEKINTYSVDFSFAKDQSELFLAKLLSKKIGSNHHEMNINTNNIFGIIESLINAHDQPFGDPANIPIYMMCKELNGDPKVILQGDGGDEVFGGYDRYLRIKNKKYYGYFYKFIKPLNNLISKNSALYRSIRTLDAFEENKNDILMAKIMSQVPYGDSINNIFSQSFLKNLKKINPYSIYIDYYNKYKSKGLLQSALYTDISIILPDVYFEKVDRASMANSIEVRVPMLDNNLAEYLLSLPANMKLRFGKKSILKSALKGLVPEEILSSPKKGFGVPISKWLRGPLKKEMIEILSNDSSYHSKIFNKTEILNRMNLHLSHKADYGLFLYKIIIFFIWFNIYGM